MKIEREVILAYALKNAIAHDGKAVVGSVISGLFNEGLTKGKVKGIIPEVKKVINKVNKMSVSEQEQAYGELEDLVGKRPEREGLPELDNVNEKKGVIMRMAPSASGPLHIGHAITSSLSFLYVQKYGGKFIVRIEDTNPENVYKESYKMIKKDCKWLFKNKCEFVIQSEHMDKYYKYIEKLLNKNAAYVCICNPEYFKELVKTKKACVCRNLRKKEQLERWGKMLDGSYKQGQAVLRFKSDLKDKNIAMRDFPLARINENKHPLQGKKYRVWPLMNLAVSVDDIEMKMTHIIRGKDHRDNAERQKMIFEVLGKKYPNAYFLGRIHFKDLELSTSKMREGIESGKFKGWDDSKLPTLISIKKQGYKPEAFWKIAEQIGLNEVDKKMSKKEFFELLKTFDKD
jgi:glutamyl-tRNA synthetase